MGWETRLSAHFPEFFFVCLGLCRFICAEFFFQQNQSTIFRTLVNFSAHQHSWVLFFLYLISVVPLFTFFSPLSPSLGNPKQIQFVLFILYFSRFLLSNSVFFLFFSFFPFFFLSFFFSLLTLFRARGLYFYFTRNPGLSDGRLRGECYYVCVRERENTKESERKKTQKQN